MSSIVPINLDRYNLWGDKKPPFTRYANNPPFTGITPTTLTGLSLNQLQQIQFNTEDNAKVLQIDGDRVTVGNAIPDIVKDLYTLDGAGQLEFIRLPYWQNTSGLFPYNIMSTEVFLGENDHWNLLTQSLSLTRDNLNLNTNQYLTHIILTVLLESPNIEMMCDLGGKSGVKYKIGGNILNNNTNRKFEANTYLLTVKVDDEFNWQDTLTFTYRNSGRFLIQLRGIIIRTLLGEVEDEIEDEVPDDETEVITKGACCGYIISGTPLQPTNYTDPTSSQYISNGVLEYTI